MSIGRAILIVVALALIAWFALSAHQAVQTTHATALISRSASPAQLRHAEALLSSAGALNPDRTVDILRAQAQLDAHHPARARAILKRVVAAEPDNLTAWVWLARASVNDRREFYLAAFRIDQLVPPLPAHR